MSEKRTMGCLGEVCRKSWHEYRFMNPHRSTTCRQKSLPPRSWIFSSMDSASTIVGTSALMNVLSILMSVCQGESSNAKDPLYRVVGGQAETGTLPRAESPCRWSCSDFAPDSLRVVTSAPDHPPVVCIFGRIPGNKDHIYVLVIEVSTIQSSVMAGPNWRDIPSEF